MVSVTGGVRALQVYAPLSAAAVSGTTNAGVAVTLGLEGAIGNGGQLAYTITSAPAKGSAVVTGNAVVYTPTEVSSGADTFKYAASYGMASAEATVTVTVTAPPVNRAPVALDDAVSTKRNTSVTIPVLANDIDADGDALLITAARKPANGSTAVQSGTILFTPNRNFFGKTAFSYTISDGKGGTATAQVQVTVTK